MKKSILLFAATLFAAATFAQTTPTVSASSVTFKYCETKTDSVKITVPAGQLPYLWNGNYITEFGTSVHTLTNARGCDSIVLVTLIDANGAIPFAFSISATEKVYFSQGNLQYCAAPTSEPKTHKVANPTGSTQPGIFRFAEHQYDFVGNASVGNVYENNTKCNNIKLAEDYSGWIDLFTWGGTGYGGDGHEPYGTSAGSSPGYNNSIDYNNNNQKYYDYGVFNAISNGGNEPGMWIMLTNQQWQYIFDGRTNAHKKIATAKVAGITGTILLPDEWTLPQGLSFEPLGNTTNNTYTAEQWKLMEANGAVFLMNNGYMSRDNNKYTYQTSPAYYWTTTWNDNPYAYQGVMSTSENNNVLYHYANAIYPYYRASVRLVRKVQ